MADSAARLQWATADAVAPQVLPLGVSPPISKDMEARLLEDSAPPPKWVTAYAVGHQVLPLEAFLPISKGTEVLLLSKAGFPSILQGAGVQGQVGGYRFDQLSALWHLVLEKNQFSFPCT